MIRTFRHKGLKELFERGATPRIEQKPVNDAFKSCARSMAPASYPTSISPAMCSTN
jgi:hypothetical protein